VTRADAGRVAQGRELCYVEQHIVIINMGAFWMNVAATVALLQAAANEDRAGMLEALRTGANPNASLDGHPPLMTAAMMGDEILVDELLRAGAKVDARDGVQGWTTTLYLAGNARTEEQCRILDRLLDAGADVNAQMPGAFGVRGNTPIETAVQLKNVEAAEVLHAHGAQCTRALGNELKRLKSRRDARGR
jgi:ankyrin repeat protein